MKESLNMWNLKDLCEKLSNTQWIHDNTIGENCLEDIIEMRNNKKLKKHHVKTEVLL